MKLRRYCLGAVFFFFAAIYDTSLYLVHRPALVLSVQFIRLWLYVRNFHSCQSTAMHLLCHTHAFLETLFTACLRSHRLSSFIDSLTCTQHSPRHLIVHIENIRTPSSPPGRRLHSPDPYTQHPLQHFSRSRHKHNLIISWADTTYPAYLHLPETTRRDRKRQQP